METDHDRAQPMPRISSEPGSSRMPSDASLSSARWWLRAIEVRFRFLLIVVAAAGFVSQWQKIQNLWNEWRFSSTSDGESVTGGYEYFCPMDPGVISSWQAICPVCSMDLVPRRKMDMQLLPEGVIARMQFTPYRIQLAGIRTSPVELRALNHELCFTGTIRPLSDADPSGQLGLAVTLSPQDAVLFQQPRTASLVLQKDAAFAIAASARLVNETSRDAESAGLPRLVIVPEDPSAIVSGTVVQATVIVPAPELLRPLSRTEQTDEAASDEIESVLAIPESALVDRGREKFVFVETMPGIFDGIVVKVARRCGAYYPVLEGLKPGQRVATAGAFLIDAETRLNPSLAAGYFGSGQSSSQSTDGGGAQTSAIQSPRPVAKSIPAKKLSVEDQRLADQQQICPVTELSLDSMGGPLAVIVAGQKVFICCAGCEARLLNDPEKYLARLEARSAEQKLSP